MSRLRLFCLIVFILFSCSDTKKKKDSNNNGFDDHIDKQIIALANGDDFLVKAYNAWALTQLDLVKLCGESKLKADLRKLFIIQAKIKFCIFDLYPRHSKNIIEYPYFVKPVMDIYLLKDDQDRECLSKSQKLFKGMDAYQHTINGRNKKQKKERCDSYLNQALSELKGLDI